MPADYTIDVKRQLVHSRAWGHVTDTDLLEHQRRLALDPRFHPDFSQLWDLLAVTNHDAVTVNGVRDVAQRHLFGPHSRRAIVAADLGSFGMARMFEAHRDIAGGEEEIRVFRRLEEAWAWLGMSPREA
jgi:hypothetical protein